MLDFPKKRDKTPRLLRNTQRQVSFHMHRSFGIIHVKSYVRIYLAFVFPKRQYESKYGKSNIFTYFSTCQTHSYDFWIMNSMYRFMYLFVVYFSFAPVISASIHRYVNYFVIQVLMMATETETLTSTLHHNIFTYFVRPKYIFKYIYIYIYRERDTSIHTYMHAYIHTYIHK